MQVLPASLALCRAPATLLALIKPQFEAERHEVESGTGGLMLIKREGVGKEGGRGEGVSEGGKLSHAVPMLLPLTRARAHSSLVAAVEGGACARPHLRGICQDSDGCCGVVVLHCSGARQ